MITNDWKKTLRELILKMKETLTAPMKDLNCNFCPSKNALIACAVKMSANIATIRRGP